MCAHSFLRGGDWSSRLHFYTSAKPSKSFCQEKVPKTACPGNFSLFLLNNCSFGSKKKMEESEKTSVSKVAIISGIPSKVSSNKTPQLDRATNSSPQPKVSYFKIAFLLPFLSFSPPRSKVTAKDRESEKTTFSLIYSRGFSQRAPEETASESERNREREQDIKRRQSHEEERKRSEGARERERERLSCS